MNYDKKPLCFYVSLFLIAASFLLGTLCGFNIGYEKAKTKNTPCTQKHCEDVKDGKDYGCK